MLRHGGASFDAVCGAALEAVRLRGQWRHANSCARYMKFGRYIRRRAGLSRDIIVRSDIAKVNLRKYIAFDILKVCVVKKASASISRAAKRPSLKAGSGAKCLLPIVKKSKVSTRYSL
jgi:hypothetical protein